MKETSVDFLRHAKFEVADSKDAPDNEWTKILEVGNANAVNLPNTATAKDAEYLTHDSKIRVICMRKQQDLAHPDVI